MYCRRSNTLRQLRGGFLQSWRAGRSHNVFGPERPTHKGCLRLTISKNTPLCFQRGGRGVEGRRAGGAEWGGGGERGGVRGGGGAGAASQGAAEHREQRYGGQSQKRRRGPWSKLMSWPTDA